jgi:hypothetical protein
MAKLAQAARSAWHLVAAIRLHIVAGTARAPVLLFAVLHFVSDDAPWAASPKVMSSPYSRRR